MNRRRSRGLSLIALMVVLALLASAALVVMRMLPAYLEYFTIRRTVSVLAHSPELRGASAHDLQRSFDNRARVDSISSVSGQDLDIQKTTDGFIVNVSYSVKVNLVGNISACIDFQASSGK